MSSKFVRENAVVPFTPSADHSEKKGYLVNVAASVATISASASVPAEGVILDGEDTTGQSAIGILGALSGTVLLKSSGVIAKGAAVVQHTDGTVITDPGSGARVKVGIALEDAVSGDLIEVATFTPQVLS